MPLPSAFILKVMAGSKSLSYRPGCTQVWPRHFFRVPYSERITRFICEKGFKELWNALFLTLPEIEELLAHVRHSFASNCAARGIDQRLIDRWLGHTTDEMRRRYQHLIPNQEQQAIGAVFG
jgi:hypothetical protein